jgi:hypothetical protein
MNEIQAQGSGEITPDTHVRMSINKLVAIGISVIVGVFLAAVAWTGVHGAIESLGKALATHIGDREVHIEPGYQFDHGRPVGKHDVEAYQAETNQALKDLSAAVDALRTELVNKRHH